MTKQMKATKHSKHLEVLLSVMFATNSVQYEYKKKTINQQRTKSSKQEAAVAQPEE